MKWTRQDVKAELLKVLDQHAQAKVEINESSQIVGDLGIDSLGVMEVIADIEDKFGLHIPDEALRDVVTVGDVANAIEGRLQADGRLQG